jgi:carboxyl-terminal processing protease
MRRVVAILGLLCAFLLGVGVGRARPPVGGATARAASAASVTPSGGIPPDAGAVDPVAIGEAAARIAASAARPVSPATLRAAAIAAMLASTGDRWAAYLDPAERADASAAAAGTYGGLGLWLRRDADGRIFVAAVAPGSPAARARIAVGDEVLAVAGRPVPGREVTDVVGALRGRPGSFVTVRLDGTRSKAGQGVRLVRLRRAEVGATNLTSGWVAPGIGLVRVAVFTRGVGAQARAAVNRLRAAGAVGFVLDLRGDPGGLVDEAVGVAGAFLDGGVVASYSGRGEPATTLTAPRGGDIDTPLAVLVDGSTASAAEIVAGALQDRRRGVLVGSRTFGKGSVQQTFTLSDGSAIELTVARDRTPDGRSLDGAGLTPDVDVTPAAAPAVALSRAVAVVRALAATG